MFTPSVFGGVFFFPNAAGSIRRHGGGKELSMGNLTAYSQRLVEGDTTLLIMKSLRYRFPDCCFRRSAAFALFSAFL